MTAILDRNTILAIARRHGVNRVRVFGSYARGQQTASSDVDLLIEFEPRRDLFDLVEFKQELEQRLGRRFDVVTEQALSPYMRDDVLREAKPL